VSPITPNRLERPVEKRQLRIWPEHRIIRITPRVIVSRVSTIDISWADRKLEKACSAEASGMRRWGADQWKILKRRLASLRASQALKDMAGVPGHCHRLTEDRRGAYAITLNGPYRLIFEPDHEPLPLMADGLVDEALVTRVRVLEVVDYHGD
jgi:proteic killer suppression protein